MSSKSRNLNCYGSVMVAIFASIAAVGVVGAVSMNTMQGPVRSMHNVTQKTIAENNMIAAGKLALMAAVNQIDGGDCDGDGTVEPLPFSTSGEGPHPTGGGYLPATIGAAKLDPWGNEYGYCVWDHGTWIHASSCGTNRLRGQEDEDGIVIAVISSGADRMFQTSCGNAPDYVIRESGSDDVILAYSYAQAATMSGGLWKIKAGDPDTAEINKDLEVRSGAGDVVFGVDSRTDIDRPAIKVDYINKLSPLRKGTEFLSNIILGDTWLSGDGDDEGLAVDSDGNVGIGTRYPQSQLHVMGGIYPQMSPPSNGDVSIHHSTPRGISLQSWGVDAGEIGGLGWPTNTGSALTVNMTAYRNWQLVRERSGGTSNYLGRLWHRGCHGASGEFCSPWMRIISENPSGNVGIGTDNPEAKLAVDGRSSGIDALRVVSSSGTFQFGTNDGNAVRMARYDNSTNPARLLLHRASGTPDTPTEYSSGGLGSIEFGAYRSGAFVGGGLSASARVSSSIAEPVAGDSVPAHLSFSTTAIGQTQNEVRMRITSEGNVGIGTVDPDNRLAVAGGVTIRGNDLGPDGRIRSYIEFDHANYFSGEKSDSSRIYRDGTGEFTGNTSNDFLVIEKTDGNDSRPDGGILFTNRNRDNVRTLAMAIRGTGNVGIGTVAPSHLLHVDGVARSAQASWATSSDQRVKENILPLESGLEKVMQLRPVTFHYTDEYAADNDALKGLKRGFIAQEVEAVLPDAVNRVKETVADKEIDDFRILGNDDFVPLLVKAVQELKARNDDLRAANENFRREMNELKKSIER